MRICYLPSDFDGPGCYRCLFPGRQLKSRGHEVVLPPYVRHPVGNGRELIEFGMESDPPEPDADVFVLQTRKEKHWVTAAKRLSELYGKLVISETDDDYVGLPAYNAGFLGSHPYDTSFELEGGRVVRRRVERELHRNHFFKVLAASDAVTVSTPALRERYSRFNSDVTVIRNFLDWDLWEDVEQQSEVERERVRVGWMGRVEWRAGDLQVLRGVLGPWLERNPQVDFVSAGSPEVHDLLGVPEGQRVNVAPVNFRDMRVAEVTAVMDIGLVPLEVNQFNEGKSHLKGMEYAACGIPCIASPTESYREYWLGGGKDGEIGFLARRAKDWVRCLQLLVEDDALRREMGRAARAEASRHTIQEHVGLWEDYYAARLKPSTDRATCLSRVSVRLGALQKPVELEGLVRLVGSPRVVLEIGTAKGGTWYVWCKQAADDALLISVDLPGGEFGGGHSLKHQELLKMYGKPGQTLEFVRGDSHSRECFDRVVEILAGREVDFLFIDGDHTYEGVKKDFEMYSPLVKDGGLVAFHDIVFHPDHPSCKVDEFWAEVKQAYPFGEIVDGGGWGGIGVLAMKRELLEVAA